jgi:hypothetical protein
MWVAIHKCMDTTQGISLYSYLHLKLAKMPCFSFYIIWFFSSTKLENKRAEQVLASGSGGGGGPENVCTCK